MIVNPTWEDAGRFVEYRPKHGPVEIGRFKSPADYGWAFVIFDRGQFADNWQDYTGQLTALKDLDWFKV